MAPRPPKSDVWRYFSKTGNNEASCNYCSKILKTSGNTSNLKAHLKIHKLKDDVGLPRSPVRPNLAKDKEISLASKSVVPSRIKSKLMQFAKSPSSDLATASTSSFVPAKDLTPMDESLSEAEAPSTFETPRPRHLVAQQVEPGPSRPPPTPRTTGFQASILQSFGDMKKFSEGGSRHCSITQSLIYFICKDSMPFSVVDGIGFRSFMKETVPLYKLPTRNTVKSMILKKYDVLSSEFRDIIDKVQYFSVTADVWSNMMTTTSYLGVTCHFLDGINAQSSVLGVIELNKSHTGDYIGEQIVCALKDWRIPTEKVVCFATDNESAMVKAINDKFGRNKHVRCLAHSINLLAESAMQNTEGLDDLIKKIREIVKFIKRSVNASDKLREEQNIRGILEGEILKPILDVKTRWNSTYYMLERFLLLSTVVSIVLVSNPESPPMLSAVELDCAKEVKTLLSNLERLTREFSGDSYVTASMVIPLLNCFLKAIQPLSPKSVLAIKLKDSLLKEFDHRFKDREHAHLLAIPMVLDARFKNIHFMDPTASARALTQIKKLVAALSNKEMSSESEAEEVEPDDPMDLWSHHKSLAIKSTKKMANPFPSSLNLDSEISLYLSTPVAANHRLNPLELWEDYKQVYPKLYVLARQYLVVVATSVPAERLFSKAGNTVTDKRNRLSGKLLSKLLFLNGLPDKYWK